MLSLLSLLPPALLVEKASSMLPHSATSRSRRVCASLCDAAVGRALDASASNLPMPEYRSRVQQRQRGSRQHLSMFRSADLARAVIVCVCASARIAAAQGEFNPYTGCQARRRLENEEANPIKIL